MFLNFFAIPFRFNHSLLSTKHLNVMTYRRFDFLLEFLDYYLQNKIDINIYVTNNNIHFISN